MAGSKRVVERQQWVVRVMNELEGCYATNVS